jgi:hypothetical protein
MRTVFKFSLEISDRPQPLILAVGAKIVLVAAQGAQICLWFELERDSSLQEIRDFAVHGTGHDIPAGQNTSAVF